MERAAAAIRPQSVELDTLAAAVMEMQEKLTEVIATLAGMGGDTNKLMETVASYRDVAACAGSSNPPRQSFSPSHLASLAPRLRAREAIKARQVLLDFNDASGPEVGALLDGSITALKDQLDKALCQSDKDGTQVSHRTRAVSKLRDRGVLMKLDSDSAAEWFAQDRIQQAFTQKLPHGINIKHHLYHMVIQFIHLLFWPEKESDL